jgi:hypothetical protein
MGVSKFRIKNGLEIVETTVSAGTLTLVDAEVTSDSTLTIFPSATSGTDTAGNDMIIQGGAGTGSGAGGDIKFNVAVAGGTGSTPNTLETKMQIASTGIVTMTDGTNATNTTSGTLQVTGGVGISANLYANVARFTGGTASSSATTGALVVTGGTGISEDLYVGEDVYVGDNLSLTSDGAIINFGADEDVLLTHVADVGLQLSTTATSGAVPIFEIYQDETDANGGVLRFTKAAGSANTADNDKLGLIQFFGDDDGGTSTNMGVIEGRIADASNNDELGRLMLRPRADSGGAGGIIIDGFTIEGILNQKHALKASIGGNHTSDSGYTLTESSSGSVINMFQYPSDNTDNSSQHYNATGGGSVVEYDVTPILNIGGGSTPHVFGGTGQGASESDYYPNLMVNGTGYTEARIRQVTAQGESNTHAGLGAAMVIESVDKHNFNGVYFSKDSTNNTAFSWNTNDPSSTLGSDETWAAGRQVGAEGLFQIGYYADGYDDIAISTTKNPLLSANMLMSIHKNGGVGVDGVTANTSSGLTIGAGSQTYSSNTNRTQNIQLNGSGGIGPLGVYVDNTGGYSTGVSAITVDDNAGGSPTLTGITSGKKLYDSSGNLIGLVTSASASTINFSGTTTEALADNEQLYGMLGGVVYFEPSQASPSITTGRLYNYNGSLYWNGSDLTAAAASALGDLSDVTITGSPSNGEILIYSESSSDFENATISGTTNEVEITNAAGSITVGLPNDVTITGDLTVSGNDLTFGNGATIINTNASTLTVTEATTAFSGNVTVSGNLTVSGDTVQQDVQTVTVEDPLIELARSNSADIIDIGFIGKYNDGANDLYAGLFRDANDSGIFKLFEDTQEDLTSATTVDTTATGYTGATLDLGTLSINTSGTQDAILTSGSVAIGDIAEETETTIDTFDCSVYQATKYLIVVEDTTNTDFLSTEILVLGDDQPATAEGYLTQYAVLYNNVELGDFTVTGSGNNINLRYTANNLAGASVHKVRVVATRIAAI